MTEFLKRDDFDLRSMVAGEHDIPADAVEYIGEPTSRGDGYHIALMTDATAEPPDVISVLVRDGGPDVTTSYTHDTIATIGEGSYTRGIRNLLSAVVNADIEDLGSRDRYPFVEMNGDF